MDRPRLGSGHLYKLAFYISNIKLALCKSFSFTEIMKSLSWSPAQLLECIYLFMR